MKATNMHAAKLQISERTESPEITHYSFRQEIRDLCNANQVLILSNFNYITSYLNRTSVGLKLILHWFCNVCQICIHSLLLKCINSTL